MAKVIWPPSNFTVDRKASKRRKAKLESYLAENVWSRDDGFVCLSKRMCRRSAVRQSDVGFYEAQGHMVGPSYDISADGIPFRVLVIPIETGTQNRHTTVERRTSAVLKAAKIPFSKRNPHMRGVTFALRLAFGLPVADPDAEYVEFADGSTAHLLESYAMTNLLLCSAVTTGTMASRSTSIMRGSCFRHMRQTIGILEPNLVISQGVVLDETLRAGLGVLNPINENVATCNLDGNPFVWVSLRHPTRNWNAVSQPYLKKIVVPSIKLARRMVFAGEP
ncbi:MAG: hypothetical protein U0Q47_01095 [Mycobacterium sp.]